MTTETVFDLSTITIMPAVHDDIYKIYMLQKRAFIQEAEINDGNYSITPILQTLICFKNDFNNFTYLKAAVNSTIIGSIRARQEGITCFIGRLVTEPVFQGFGIGTMLLTAIENSFPTATRFELFTGERSVNNVRFYKNRGYTVTDKKEDIPGVILLMFEKKR